VLYNIIAQEVATVVWRAARTHPFKRRVAAADVFRLIGRLLCNVVALPPDPRRPIILLHCRMRCVSIYYNITHVVMPRRFIVPYAHRYYTVLLLPRF